MLNILICDDSSIERKVLSKILRDLGFGVTITENGEEALNEITSDKYSLIFLDLIMPKMDGWETAKVIREIKGLEFPIIGVSSVTSSFDLERAKVCGIDRVLAKPFNTIQIEMILNEFLRPQLGHKSGND
jgi:CheY-like chemotaxis protein